MALQHTEFLTIRCTDCQEEMYIQRMTPVGNNWNMIHVAPDGLVCPFCTGKIVTELRKALTEIASGPCCQSGGSFDDPCCDVMVARAALEGGE